jgi:hypothetical protein
MSAGVMAALTHQMVCRTPRNRRISRHFFAFGASDIFLYTIHEFLLEVEDSLLVGDGGHFFQFSFVQI